MTSKIPFWIQVATAFVCSRMIFLGIADPEGPNLLIVTVMALVIFAISATAYRAPVLRSLTGAKRTVAAIVLQMLLAASLCAAMR